MTDDVAIPEEFADVRHDIQHVASLRCVVEVLVLLREQAPRKDFSFYASRLEG